MSVFSSCNIQSRLIALVGAAVLICFSQIADAQCGTQAISTIPLVLVNGDAQVLVSPDRATVTFGVETTGIVVAETRQRHQNAIKSVVRALREIGVAESQIGTDYLNLDSNPYSYGKSGKNESFQLRQSIVVTLTKLELLDDAFFAATSNGANTVSGVNFEVQDLRQHRDHARTLALIAAKEKAILMASELGSAIDTVHQISEVRNSWSGWRSSWWGRQGFNAANVNSTINSESSAQASQSNEAIPVGKIAVTASVAVQYRLK